MCRSVWLAGLVAISGYSMGPVRADLLWFEGAENGLLHVVDNTDSSYSLIQSQVVATGNNAFHLANPVFESNWFTIDQTLRIEPDTKLFFLSQLRTTTKDQVARVQISTDGGSTWDTNIFNQPGKDNPAEAAFSLREVDLGGYADQDLRFRFGLDFDFGSAYTQTSTCCGWYVDNIQIGSEFDKLMYSIGDPSPAAQLSLEFVNRARSDALAEASRLPSDSDPNFSSTYAFYGITKANIEAQYAYYVNNGCMDQFAQPLAFNERLLQASELHSQDMLANAFQGHSNSSNPPAPLVPNGNFSSRLASVGYSGAAGENVYAFAKSMWNAHVGFGVDWGKINTAGATCYNPDFNQQGMQNPAGHRMTIHNGEFKEAGFGVVSGTNGTVGPHIVTQNFGNPGDVTYITGVVYQDLNGNQFYDVGEGRSGVRIDVDGSAYYALSSSSGGYAVPVSRDGSYRISFSGGGLANYDTTAVVANRENVKVDFVSTLASLMGDLNSDGSVDAADAGIMFANWTQSGVGDLTGDGIVDAADAGVLFEAWTGDGEPMTLVPEPTSVASSILLFGLLVLGGRRPTYPLAGSATA